MPLAGGLLGGCNAGVGWGCSHFKVWLEGYPLPSSLTWLLAVSDPCWLLRELVPQPVRSSTEQPQPGLWLPSELVSNLKAHSSPVTQPWKWPSLILAVQSSLGVCGGLVPRPSQIPKSNGVWMIKHLCKLGLLPFNTYTHLCTPPAPQLFIRQT